MTITAILGTTIRVTDHTRKNNPASQGHRWSKIDLLSPGVHPFLNIAPQLFCLIHPDRV